MSHALLNKLLWAVIVSAFFWATRQNFDSIREQYKLSSFVVRGYAHTAPEHEVLQRHQFQHSDRLRTLLLLLWLQWDSCCSLGSLLHWEPLLQRLLKILPRIWGAEVATTCEDTYAA
jgi:hypothetical protein